MAITVMENRAAANPVSEMGHSRADFPYERIVRLAPLSAGPPALFEQRGAGTTPAYVRGLVGKNNFKPVSNHSMTKAGLRRL